MLLIILFYIGKLFALQVIDNEYNQLADNNAILTKIQYPSRGLIYDREGRLVVDNQPTYDLMVIPREVQSFDTLDLCRTLGITYDQYRERWRNMSNRRRNVSFPVSRSRNTVCCRKNCTVIPVFSFRTSRFVVIPTMREPMCWEIYVRYLRKN